MLNNVEHELNEEIITLSKQLPYIFLNSHTSMRKTFMGRTYFNMKIYVFGRIAKFSRLSVLIKPNMHSSRIAHSLSFTVFVSYFRLDELVGVPDASFNLKTIEFFVLVLISS